jgi:hypothetical protein
LAAKIEIGNIKHRSQRLGAWTDLIGIKIDRDQSFLLFEAIAHAIGSARHVLTVCDQNPGCANWNTLNLLRSSLDRQSPSVGEHSFWPPGREPR